MSANYELRGSVAVITLNNPPVNGLGHETRKGIVEGLEKAQADAAVKAIVITGAGKAFSGGADIREFGSPMATSEPNLLTVIRACELSTKPIVAAIHTVCMGGGLELALGCHYRVASAGALVALPEVKIGLIPGAGGTQRAIRILGKPLALEMILAGRRLTAEEALQHGLVSRVVERDALLAEARRIAGEIAKRSPVAIRLAREAVAAALETSLEDGLAREREGFAVAISSEDAKEGFAAFLEKRPPHFRGR